MPTSCSRLGPGSTRAQAHTPFPTPLAHAHSPLQVTFIHPIDVLKTRLQVSGDAATGARNYKALGIGGSLAVIAREEGVGAFWKGIGAAWLREASYTSLRLGLYGPIKTVMGIKKDSNFFMKFVAGGLAGALGSTVGNPFDVRARPALASALRAPLLPLYPLPPPAPGAAARTRTPTPPCRWSRRA